jgi:hypothetical protein
LGDFITSASSDVTPAGFYYSVLFALSVSTIVLARRVGGLGHGLGPTIQVEPAERAGRSRRAAEQGGP